MGALDLLEELSAFMETGVEVSHPETTTVTSFGRTRDYEAVRTKITVTNTAPYTVGYPKVVFVGVGVGIRKRRLGAPDTPKWARENIRKVRGKSESSEAKAGVPEYRRADGQPFPEITSVEGHYGEPLFPGESVSWEMMVPVGELRSGTFRMEGNLSRRHLFRREQVLEVGTSTE